MKAIHNNDKVLIFQIPLFCIPKDTLKNEKQFDNLCNEGKINFLVVLYPKDTENESNSQHTFGVTDNSYSCFVSQDTEK